VYYRSLATTAGYGCRRCNGVLSLYYLTVSAGCRPGWPVLGVIVDVIGGKKQCLGVALASGALGSLSLAF